ncbi:MAG: Bug family tripartite tricarboxylate transporter substrate binding protein [Cupriavidus necator]
MLFIHAICHAQGYPSRTITVVVPSSPGGGLDLLARAFAQEMGRQMGQTVIVDNKPGAGGILAVQAVRNAAPDGYTLLVTHSAPIINTPHLFTKVPYVVRRDLAFVSEIAMGRVVLAVNHGVPARNMQELLAWAARNKGKVSYGSYGVGSFGHLAGAYLNQARGLDMTHVAYKSEAPMVQDLSAGQIAWGISSLATLTPHIESGKVRPLAVFGDRRIKSLPNVPTIAETGLTDPQLKPVGWVGMLAPAGTPAAILARLEREAQKAARSAPVRTRLETFDSELIGSTAAEFKREFEATEPVVKRLIEMAGAKAD